MPKLYFVDFLDDWIDILVFKPFPKKFFSSRPIVKEVFSTESYPIPNENDPVKSSTTLISISTTPGDSVFKISTLTDLK